MNNCTQELTASLQQLANRSRQNASDKPLRLPKNLKEGDLVFSAEVQSFLNARRRYSARTRNVSVGTY